MKFTYGFTVIVLAQWMLCSFAFSQAPHADVKPGPQSVANITDAEPKNNGDERVKAALESFQETLATKPTEAAAALVTRHLKVLVEGQRWEEIVTLGQAAILSHPVSPGHVGEIQSARVRAMLALNRPEEALSGAKSLYNVSSMARTRDALLLVAECLNAAKKNDGDSAQQLSQEQMAGAAYQPTTGATTQPAAGDQTVRDAANGAKSTIMAAIRVDPAPYAAALEAINGEDYRSLVARGNLLLLADRPDEAMKVFERAYAVADQKALVAASEDIARAIKAQDGTIGRANAWVLSLRPATQEE